VQPVADAVGATLLMVLVVEAEGQVEAVFATVKERQGRLDILVHSIALLPDR